MGSILVGDSDFSLSHAPVMLNISYFTFNYQAQKCTIFIHLSLLMMNSAVLIQAVCRTPVTYELSKMTVLSMSSCSSVDRAPARCSGGHAFDSCWGLRFFFVPCSCHVEYFIFHIVNVVFKCTWLRSCGSPATLIDNVNALVKVNHDPPPTPGYVGL